MTSEEKNAILDRLSVSYIRTYYLRVICKDKGLQDEAGRLARREARLKIEIDGLLRDLYQDWIGQSNALRETIEAENKVIEECIKDIEGDIETAQNIVKAIGYIDEVIQVAADLVL